MTYFEDLSTYSFLPGTLPDGVTALNVGWLDGEHSFGVGQPPSLFIEALGELCAECKAARTRGFHWCDLCPEDEFSYPVAETIGGRRVALGGAELRVYSQAGDILTAPDLVYHYVTKHHYLPPDAFIEAVLARRLTREPVRE